MCVKAAGQTDPLKMTVIDMIIPKNPADRAKVMP